MISLGQSSNRNVWLTWLACSLLIAVVQFPTLAIDPAIIQDEVQIVDLGRTALEPRTDWSITWHVAADIPVLTFSYIGPVIQELAYRVSSPSYLGPRITASVAAVLAATCLLGWLLARRTTPWVGLILAVAFLLDAIFLESYRGGRIDSFVLAAVLGACWLLRLANTRVEAHKPIGCHVFLAGALVGLSPFLWANAPILAPLVLLEIFYLAKSLYRLSTPQRHLAWIIEGAKFAAGALIVLALALIPIVMELERYATSALSILEMQRFAAEVKGSIIDIFLVHDPFIALTAVVAILIRREIGMLIALALAVLIVYQTMIYPPRVLYLFPYLAGMIAFAARREYLNQALMPIRLAFFTFAILLPGWNIWNGLVVGPAKAIASKPSNDPAHFVRSLESLVGPGDYRVLVEAWPHYYAGRILGWKMYHAGNKDLSVGFDEFVTGMDFIVIRENPIYRTTKSRISDKNFELIGVVQTPISQLTPESFSPGSQGKTGTYPPIEVYRNNGLRVKRVAN